MITTNFKTSTLESSSLMNFATSMSTKARKLENVDLAKNIPTLLTDLSQGNALTS